MAGIPGGRGPRQPQDQGEWFDQRSKQSRNLQPNHIVRYTQPPETAQCNTGDLVLCKLGGNFQLPPAIGLAGQAITFRTTYDAVKHIVVRAGTGDSIDGDLKTYIGSRGGSLTLMSDGSNTWMRVAGDQNICFHIYKSTSINDQLLNSTNPFYCDTALIDTLNAFTSVAPADTTQGTYTVPESGMYSFGGVANADATAAADTCTVTLRIDGANYLSGCRIGTTGATVDPASSVDVKSVYLVTGQTVYLYATGATNLTIVEGQIYSGFWGRKHPN